MLVIPFQKLDNRVVSHPSKWQSNSGEVVVIRDLTRPRCNVADLLLATSSMVWVRCLGDWTCARRPHGCQMPVPSVSATLRLAALPTAATYQYR